MVKNSTCLSGIYSHAGGSTVSYVHLYQVRNTLLLINYSTCLVSTMAPSSFGPYHGMSLEDAQTKCIGVVPKSWAMTHALDLGCHFLHSISSWLRIESKKMLQVGVCTKRHLGGISMEMGWQEERCQSRHKSHSTNNKGWRWRWKAVGGWCRWGAMMTDDHGGRGDTSSLNNVVHI